MDNRIKKYINQYLPFIAIKKETFEVVEVVDEITLLIPSYFENTKNIEVRKGDFLYVKNREKEEIYGITKEEMKKNFALLGEVHGMYIISKENLK